jgi:hypothetical protein
LPARIFERALALQDHRVVAVGEIAHDQRRGVDAAARGDRERVHVGRRDPVEGARGVLVDRFDVIVDLHDLDVDAVFLGPFVHDAAVFEIAPGHPAHIDRPRDAERKAERGRGGKCKSGHCPGSSGWIIPHVRPEKTVQGERPNLSRSALPGFWPAVYRTGICRSGRISRTSPGRRATGRNPKCSALLTGSGTRRGTSKADGTRTETPGAVPSEWAIQSDFAQYVSGERGVSYRHGGGF